MIPDNVLAKIKSTKKKIDVLVGINDKDFNFFDIEATDELIKNLKRSELVKNVKIFKNMHNRICEIIIHVNKEEL